MKDEPIGGLLASRPVWVTKYQPTMTALEQSIYAAVYGARMARWLDSASRAHVVQRSTEDDAEQLADLDLMHAASAKADAKLAVELHGATND